MLSDGMSELCQESIQGLRSFDKRSLSIYICCFSPYLLICSDTSFIIIDQVFVQRGAHSVNRPSPGMGKGNSTGFTLRCHQTWLAGRYT